MYDYDLLYNIRIFVSILYHKSNMIFFQDFNVLGPFEFINIISLLLIFRSYQRLNLGMKYCTKTVFISLFHFWLFYNDSFLIDIHKLIYVFSTITKRLFNIGFELFCYFYERLFYFVLFFSFFFNLAILLIFYTFF